MYNMNVAEKDKLLQSYISEEMNKFIVWYVKYKIKNKVPQAETNIK